MAKKINDDQLKRLYDVLFNAVLLDIALEELYPEYKIRVTDSDYRGFKLMLDLLQENVRELLSGNREAEEEIMKRLKKELAREMTTTKTLR